MRPLIFFLVISIARLAHAEYRAYQLLISNTQTSQTRVVYSILDDIQYPSYYPLRIFETIVLQDSWMCWGHHGEGRRICPNPRAAAQAPATVTAPSTSSAPAPARP